MNQIFITTDVHGQYLNYDFNQKKEIANGLDRIATYLKARKNENTILIDNGDFFQGHPLNAYYYKFGDIPHPGVKSFNEVGYDYYNFGNHDFNFGKENLKEFYTQINAPVITTNVVVDNEGFSAKVHEFKDGMKVGLIGIVTDFVNVWEPKENLEGIKIHDSYQRLGEEIEKMRSQGVDYIIGIYHGGVEKDLEDPNIITSSTGENKGYKFCEDFDFDVLVTGHEHREFITTINQTLVTQSSDRAKSFVQLNLSPEKINAQIIKTADLEKEDNALFSSFSAERAKLEEWLKVPLFSLPRPYLITNQHEDRINYNDFFRLVNQVIMNITGADLASVAFSDTITGFNRDVSQANLMANFMFDNDIHLYETTALVLKEYLNHSLKFLKLNSQNEVIFDPSKLYPKNEIYNYEMVGGITYEVDLTKPEGERVVSISKNGQELGDEDKVVLAMSSYRSTGAGDYAMVKEMKLVKTMCQDIKDMIVNALTSNPEIDINHESMTLKNPE